MRIGTAGWSIPRAVAEHFPPEGTSLERYAARFNAAEINSSFHRPHRASTWRRWAESVPADFRFAAKVPKAVTHTRKLMDCGEELNRFFGETAELGDKLAVVLVQLPPKLEFDPELAEVFFAGMASRTTAIVACEPRNAGWFSDAADRLLARLRVSRVAADPALCPEAARPGGWHGFSYWRLHGSPVMYRSSYDERLPSYAALLRREAAERETWCIFDNTASSAAAGDALALTDLLDGQAHNP